jgi:hypothetical protein
VTNIRRYLQSKGPHRNRRVRGSPGLGKLIRYALLEDEATSFVSGSLGCSIESPLIHQSKPKAATGIGCEWLSREETCVCVWVWVVLCLSLSQTGADEGGYENLAGGQEATCRWVRFFR